MLMMLLSWFIEEADMSLTICEREVTELPSLEFLREKDKKGELSIFDIIPLQDNETEIDLRKNIITYKILSLIRKANMMSIYRCIDIMKELLEIRDKLNDKSSDKKIESLIDELEYVYLQSQGFGNSNNNDKCYDRL